MIYFQLFDDTNRGNLGNFCGSCLSAPVYIQVYLD